MYINQFEARYQELEYVPGESLSFRNIKMLVGNNLFILLGLQDLKLSHPKWKK